jgi:hypothetical protein
MSIAIVFIIKRKRSGHKHPRFTTRRGVRGKEREVYVPLSQHLSDPCMLNVITLPHEASRWVPFTGIVNCTHMTVINTASRGSLLGCCSILSYPASPGSLYLRQLRRRQGTRDAVRSQYRMQLKESPHSTLTLTVCLPWVRPAAADF